MNAVLIGVTPGVTEAKGPHLVHTTGPCTLLFNRERADIELIQAANEPTDDSTGALPKNVP